MIWYEAYYKNVSNPIKWKVNRCKKIFDSCGHSTNQGQVWSFHRVMNNYIKWYLHKMIFITIFYTNSTNCCVRFKVSHEVRPGGHIFTWKWCIWNWKIFFTTNITPVIVTMKKQVWICFFDYDWIKKQVSLKRNKNLNLKSSIKLLTY